MSTIEFDSAEQNPVWKVKWSGAQKNVMAGDLTAHITLKTLEGLTHLYLSGHVEEVLLTDATRLYLPQVSP